jgi:hypothetical protein
MSVADTFDNKNLEVKPFLFPLGLAKETREKQSLAVQAPHI